MPLGEVYQRHIKEAGTLQNIIGLLKLLTPVLILLPIDLTVLNKAVVLFQFLHSLASWPL